mmetsp:Transcript_92019/g.259978  ORF Transcript_92019/g.259978 Transcript_92019/m.259978 type:complete len:201 (+) Transcript_92019:736-1338(+)
MQLTVLAVARCVPGCQQHAFWAPTELVPQGIGAGRLGRWEPAAERREAEDAISNLAFRLVDHLHCAHMVDARVKAHLVDDQDARSPGLGIKRLHFLADIRRGDHRLAMLDREARDADVQRRWHERNNGIARLHEGLARGRFVGVGRGDVHNHRAYAGAKTLGERLHFAAHDARHGERVFGAPQQELNEGGRDKACAKHEH